MLRSIFKNKGDITSPDAPVTSEGIELTFNDCYDFEKRELLLGGHTGKKVTLMYIDGLTSGGDIAEQVIRPLTSDQRFNKDIPMGAAIDMMVSGMVYGATVKKRTKLSDAVSDLLNAYCVIVFDGEKTAVSFEVKSQEKRSVDQPKEENVVKGSKDAFVETIKTNTALIRRKVKNPNLKIKSVTIGKKTDTMIAIVYIDGFTNKNMVAEAERRLSAIQAEEALTSAVVEENIADNSKTPFPQLLNTERPDKFCLNLMEGRVGIIVDGLPLGFLAPGTFSQFFKAPEDHSNHFIIASALTVLRYFSLILSLLLPAFYVSVAMYHQEMLPIKLMQSIIEAKKSVPFPTAFEVLAMLIAFELLQEAALRLPNPVGDTVSIIGALIVGQAAVEAKVVSPVVVIIIALTGITGYMIPNQDMSAAIRICRFLLVLMAILMGMFGLAIGVALMMYHLSSLETFGVPYMSPFCGSDGKYLLRALFRFSMKKKKDADPELKPEEKQ